MTEYAEEFIPELEGYSYNADDLKIDGEIYTLPWESRTFVYWYRDDVFDTVPQTLPELADTASEKSEALAQGFVIGLSDGSNAASFYGIICSVFTFRRRRSLLTKVEKLF